MNNNEFNDLFEYAQFRADLDEEENEYLNNVSIEF